MPLKTGIYMITNVKQRNLVRLRDPNDGTPLSSDYKQDTPSEQWQVTDRGNGQHSILNIDFQRYANSGTRAGLNASVEGRDREQLWYIRERSKGKYTIATTDSGNYWMLPDEEIDTPVGLLSTHTDQRCWWFFTDPKAKVPVDDGVSEEAVLFELKRLPIVPFSPLRLDFVIIQEITNGPVSNMARTMGEVCGALVPSTMRQHDTLRVNIVEFEPLGSSAIIFRRFTGVFTVEKLCTSGDSDISWQPCYGSSVPEVVIRGLRPDAAKVAILSLNVTLLQQGSQANVRLINGLARQNINLILTPIQPTFDDTQARRRLISSSPARSSDSGKWENSQTTLSTIIKWLLFPGCSSTVSGTKQVDNTPDGPLAKLREAIIRDMPHLTELLKGDDHDARSSVVEALYRLAEHAELDDIIRQAMPHIMKVLKDEGHDAPSATVAAPSEHEAIPRDSSGRTPLLWAAGSGYDEVARLLLVLEVEIDAKDNNGQTPLSWAAEEGHDEVVKRLLAKNGVDANSKSKVNDTPLIWAASKGHGGVVSLLLAHKDIDVNTKQNDGLTPLSVAARVGHNEVVCLLLEKGGVEVDAKDKAGRTPLLHAAEEGRDEVVKLLLAKNGVDANSKSKSNDTPLMWAAYKGNSGVVRLLLAHKNIDVDAKNDDSRTPLSLADDEGHGGVKGLLNERIRQRSGNRMGSQPL